MAVFYLGLALAGCMSPPQPVVPVGVVPLSIDSAAGWSARSLPVGRLLLRFKWQYQDDRSAVGGRGSAHIAGPDSIRFDVAGPLGTNPAAAFVVADSPRWVRPEDAIRKLVPSYPLMWAAFGIARGPGGASVLLAGTAAGARVWREVAGADTIEWALAAGRLVAEVRRDGGVVGRTETILGPDGRLISARLTMPEVPARLDLTFTLSDPSARFPANVWHPREP